MSVPFVDGVDGMEQQNNRFGYRNFLVLFALIGLTACDAQADTMSDPPAKEQQIYARRITVTRCGYGKARPDLATIDLPFAVTGETWEAVEKQRTLLLTSLKEEVAPYDRSDGAVSVFSLQGGQTYQDGKTLMNDTGTIRVSVRDLSHWKEILTVLGEKNSQPLRLGYQVTDVPALQRARVEAQRSAITQARQDADRLAGMAGTRVIGVLEIREGAVRSEELYSPDFGKRADNAIPQEISAVAAEITVSFELAPPVSEQPTIKTKQKGSKKPNS